MPARLMYPIVRFVRQTQCKLFQKVLQLHHVLIESWAFESTLRVGSGRNQSDESKFGADEDISAARGSFTEQKDQARTRQ
jgi:hypothetical protein